MSDSHRNPTADRFYVYDGEDLARLEELEEQVEATSNGAPRLLHEEDSKLSAVAEYNAFLTEAKERAQVIVLREVGRRKRRELLEANPPREGNAVDEGLGANADDLGDALLHACMASPPFDSETARDEYIESLGAKWYDKLSRAAFSMNFGDVSAPKALTTPSPSSDET